MDVPDGRRVALVTGGAGGIGRATTRELVAHGWHVVIGDLDLDAAGSAAESVGENASMVELDVTSADSVEAAVAGTAARLGRLDLLVNNAGIQRHGPLESLVWDEWRAVLDVNLDGVVRCLQAAGRQMLASGGGAIVNVASIAAERGQPGRAAYAAAKAAVVAVTRTAAVEWAARGVRVNAVGPGYVDSELVRSFVEAGKLDLGPVLAHTPMRRLAEPDEIARVVRFLASDDASFVTGQVLYADGGFLADFGVPAR
jgi:3-oxoacyl-[acyl-carrier protein] reductase